MTSWLCLIEGRWKREVGGDVHGVRMGVRWYYNPSSQETRREDQYLKASWGYSGIENGWGRDRMGGIHLLKQA